MTSRFVEGQALVASPYLADRNFLRAVVYIVKHDDEGAYGLILNRPTNISVGKLLQHILEEEIENDQPIYHGGPVEGPVVVLHDQPRGESTEYKPGVYLTSDQDDFADLCKQPRGRYRVFNGYAGWAPNQLEDELTQGGWLVWDISCDDLFASADEVWQDAIRKIGREIIMQSIAGHAIPDDPSTN